MKRYIYILGSFCLMFLVTSCSDFLKETSQDEFEPKTVESYQELLNGSGYNTATTIDAFTNLLGDDVSGCAASSYSYTTANLSYKDIYTWQSYMDATLQGNSITNILNSYQNLYSYIMTCNLVIDNIDDAEGTTDEKNQTKGEALAMRAYYYWYLVNLYAKPYNTAGTTPDKLLGVPVITKSEIKDGGVARNTVAEVYAQMTSDIETACTLLEQEKSNSVGLYRMNYVSAHLLASRIYLYMDNWDKVIAHADSSLVGAPALCNLSTYSFSNTSKLYKSTNEIMSSNFSETIFIGGNNSLLIKTEGTPFCVSNDLMSLYTTGDTRKTSYFMKMNSYYSYPYYMCKYGTSEQAFTFRTSELYLNLAEAYAEKYKNGDQASGQKAVDDLNELRENRLTNYTAYQLGTADDLVEFCHEERRRELCFEIPRWFDLRRYGMPSFRHLWIDATGVHSYYTLQQNDPGYVLPIPDEAITLNSSLVQNELAPTREAETN